MEKLEKLTSEQELKMYEVRDFWLNYINSCQNSVNKENATIGINWLYEGIKKKAPAIFFVASPLGCQIGINYLKELNKANVGANVWDNVGDNVWDNVRANVGANYESFSKYGSISDYGWVSFFDFFTQIGVLNHDGFNKFKNLISSGIYDMIQMDGVCIVSDLPCKLLRNLNQELHCLDGYAIEFKDSYGQHYINGIFLPHKYFDSISNNSFTMSDFIKEENEEYKSTCIAFMQEKYGNEYLINFFRENLSEIDTFVDKKDTVFLEGTTKGMNIGVYTLFKGEINNEEISYVRCYCPSTDRMFFLGVDNSNNTAKNAIASLYRIPKALKAHIKSISRQGERFSTILSEEGKELLKTLSKEEIGDTVGLDGEDYFKLIKFEY